MKENIEREEREKAFDYLKYFGFDLWVYKGGQRKVSRDLEGDYFKHAKVRIRMGVKKNVEI